MNSEAKHELNLLEAVEQNGHVTQRGLASKVGIAVGLTNIYLKRLVRKGYIKCINVRSNRLLYLITPTGIAEKTRLTYEYVEYSLRLYGETRQLFRAEMKNRLKSSDSLVTIYGTGEAAELAYLCLKELGIEPVAIFNGEVGQFLGMRVRPLIEHVTVAYDLVIIASLEDSGPLISRLVEAGIPQTKLCTLRPQASQPSEPSVEYRR